MVAELTTAHTPDGELMTFWQMIGRAILAAAETKTIDRPSGRLFGRSDVFVVQAQDRSGLWNPVGSSGGTLVDAAQAMKSAARMFPGSKIRVIDAEGRLVDLTQPGHGKSE